MIFIATCNAMLAFCVIVSGCESLDWDAAGVRCALLEKGLREVPTRLQADIVVVMGCTFTQKHENDFRDAIRTATKGQGTQHIIVSGCYLRTASADRIHYVRKEGIPDLVDSILRDRSPDRASSPLRLPAPLPFVAISEGCYGHCAFCSIRQVRGTHHSRPQAHVLADVRAAFNAHGCAKLVGQEIAAYGRDTGSSLPTLLRDIFRAVPGIKLELGSLGPAWMKRMKTAELSVFADHHITGNIHLPLQSASDSVLKRMHRGYTIGQYVELMSTLRSLGVTRFSTDLIAGFPGETRGDHQSSVAFLRDNPMAFAQIFAYEPRPGTPAARLRPPARSTRVRRALELAMVFLAHCPAFCRDERADINRFLNSNVVVKKEEAYPR